MWDWFTKKMCEAVEVHRVERLEFRCAQLEDRVAALIRCLDLQISYSEKNNCTKFTKRKQTKQEK